MTEQHAENPRRFQNFTGASWVILIIAIVSVIVDSIVFSEKASSTPREGAPLAGLLPHLLIVASMSTGLRILGDVVALFAGSFFCLAGVVMALGTAFSDPVGHSPVADRALTFALLQGVMVILALADLFNSRKLHNQPIPFVNRLLGLSVPLVVYLITWGVTTAAVKWDEPRIASEARTRQVNAQIQGSAWMYHSELDNLLTLAQCVERFRGDSIAGPALRSLRELYSWSTNHSACAAYLFQQRRDIYGNPSKLPPLDTLPHPTEEDVHHLVYYEPPANLRGDPFRRARFTLGIEAVWDSVEFPNAVGQPGKRNYLLDPDGNIHVTADRRRATVSDPIVPVCAPDQRSTNDQECRPAFESRQRWGVVTSLPSFSIFVHPDRRNVFLPDSAWAGLSFRQVSALDSIRAVSIDWGDGRKQTVINLAPSKSINPYFDLPVHHAYADSGDKIIRARLVTRAGEEYRAEATIFVSAPDRQ